MSVPADLIAQARQFADSFGRQSWEKPYASRIRNLADALEQAGHERDEALLKLGWRTDQRAGIYGRLEQTEAELAAARQEAEKLREALREIKRRGVKFDARGTHSREVYEIARAALADSAGAPPETT